MMGQPDMSVSYQQEFLDTFVRDAIPLLERHWEEIALNKHVIKLDPDWDAYAILEQQGNLKIFTARKSGVLIGYFAVFFRKHIHHKNDIFAVNDVIFISPEYRKGMIGTNLIKFAEQCLKDDGATVLLINTKCHKPFDKLLEWLGFTHIENVYSKLLR